MTQFERTVILILTFQFLAQMVGLMFAIGVAERAGVLY